jgi:Arabinose efflux permease
MSVTESARLRAPSLPWPALIVLAAAVFLSITIEMMPTGLLPEMSEGLGVTEPLVGLLVSVFAFTVVLTSTSLTALTARMPRHALLVVVLAVLGVMMGGIMVGLTAFAPTYLQVSAGISPVWAGVAVAAMAIGLPVSSALAARLYLRWGLRRTTVIGAVSTFAGAAGLAASASFPSPWIVAACAAMIGIGFGFTTVPGLVAVQESVDWDQRGVVTGLVTFFRSLGQAIGVAVLGAVAKSVLDTGPSGEQDPAVVLAASTAVFVVVAGFALVHLSAAFAMPGAQRVSIAPSPVAQNTSRSSR